MNTLNCVLAGCTVLLLALSVGGCSWSGAGPITSSSVNAPYSLELSPSMRAYSAVDKNTADVYVTDLPREAMEPGASTAEVSGQILHVHLFISPEAGSTPIDQTACSVTVRLVILSRGHVGMYGGGGFLLPDSDPGSVMFEGDLRGATLRLIASTPGFTDRLGPAELSGAIEAPRDEAMAMMMARRLDEVLGMLKSGTAPSAPDR